MSFAAQFQSLLVRAGQMRMSLFGAITIEYDIGTLDRPNATPARTVTGYHSSLRHAVKSQETGFLAPHDCVVRFAKTSGFTPELDKFIRIIFPDGSPPIKMRIAEFPEHKATMEWVLGCKRVL